MGNQKLSTVLYIFIVCFATVVFFAGFFISADAASEPQQVDNSIDANAAWVQESNSKVSEILKSEENIQYYANLSTENVDDSLKEIILAARNKIIFRYSWVSDEVNGRVCDENGTIIEELPHFSDLFPEDWDEPVLNVVVDLSYYT